VYRLAMAFPATALPSPTARRADAWRPQRRVGRGRAGLEQLRQAVRVWMELTRTRTRPCAPLLAARCPGMSARPAELLCRPGPRSSPQTRPPRAGAHVQGGWGRAGVVGWLVGSIGVTRRPAQCCVRAVRPERIPWAAGGVLCHAARAEPIDAAHAVLCPTAVLC
jgi:hypothetical protein